MVINYREQNIYILEVYLLKYILKATSYINDAIIENNLQLMNYYGALRRYKWSMHAIVSQFLRNLYDAA